MTTLPTPSTLRASVTATTLTGSGVAATVLIDGSDTEVTANGLVGYSPTPGDRLLVQLVGTQLEVLQFVSVGVVPYASGISIVSATFPPSAALGDTWTNLATTPDATYVCVVAYTTGGSLAVNWVAVDATAQAIGVPKTTTINRVPLSSNIVLTPLNVVQVTAPTSSPAVTATSFGIGGVKATWPLVARAEFYDVYASATTGVTTASEFVGTVQGTTMIITTLAGAPIVSTANTFMAVVARNTAGSAAIGVEGAATARQATGADISALYAYLGIVQANQISTGTLDAIISISTDGVINVGDRITIADPNAADGKGGITIWSDAAHTNALVKLHPDGSVFQGAVTADQITVITALKIISNMYFSGGSTTTIQNGVADPLVGPTLTQGTITSTWPSDPTDYATTAICWDEVNSQWWQLLWRTSTSRAYIRTVSLAGVAGSLVLLALDTTGQAITGCWGLAKIGGIIYSGFNVGATFSNQIIGQWNTDGTKAIAGASVAYINGGSTNISATPGLGTDGTWLYVVYKYNATQVGVQRYTPGGAGSGSRTFLTVTVPDTERFRYVNIGLFDFGSATVSLVFTSAATTRRFTVAPTWNGDILPEDTTKRWSHVQDLLGATYKTTGTNLAFYTFSNNNGKIDRHGAEYPAAGEKQWVRYRDMNAGLGTKPSPEVSILTIARRFLTVNLPAMPNGVVSAEVYVGYGTVTPGSSMWLRTETPTGRSWLLINGKVVTGTAIVLPGTNLLGGTPAILQSEAGGFIIKGDGSGSLGKLDYTASGAGVTPAIAAAATTYVTAITFPTGRFSSPPAVTVTMNVLNGSTATMNYAAVNITTLGANIQFQRSAAAAAQAFNWTAIQAH